MCDPAKLPWGPNSIYICKQGLEKTVSFIIWASVVMMRAKAKTKNDKKKEEEEKGTKGRKQEEVDATGFPFPGLLDCSYTLIGFCSKSYLKLHQLTLLHNYYVIVNNQVFLKLLIKRDCSYLYRASDLVVSDTLTCSRWTHVGLKHGRVALTHSTPGTRYLVPRWRHMWTRYEYLVPLHYPYIEAAGFARFVCSDKPFGDSAG